MASLENNPMKRKRPDDSPDELSKNVDICRHCNKKCTKKSEAVQCIDTRLIIGIGNAMQNNYFGVSISTDTQVLYP